MPPGRRAQAAPLPQLPLLRIPVLRSIPQAPQAGTAPPAPRGHRALSQPSQKSKNRPVFPAPFRQPLNPPRSAPGFVFPVSVCSRSGDMIAAYWHLSK